MLCVGSVGLMVVLFFTVPRVGTPQLPRFGNGNTVASVGFTEEVTLTTGATSIQEDPYEVLTVQFYDERRQRPVMLADGPWLRGTTLFHYDGNSWVPRYRESKQEPDFPWAPKDADGKAKQYDLGPLEIREIFDVRPVLSHEMTVDTLFWVSPAVKVASPDYNDVQYIASRHQLTRWPTRRHDDLHYELLTSSIREVSISRYEQLEWTPRYTRPDASNSLINLRETPTPLLGVDPLLKLRATAQTTVADIPVTDPVARARALNWHLRSSGLYIYSLQPVPRDPRVDPVEDFIDTHRMGHCEFFASALALMLRSVNIPSRVVSGYEGGEWDAEERRYVFRQLHAHTWVEAYIDDEHAPPEVVAQVPSWGNGYWLRLDPTAPPTSIAALEEGAHFDLFALISQYAGVFWAANVRGMNAERQWETIYRPVGEAARSFAVGVVTPSAWPRGGRRLFVALFPWARNQSIEGPVGWSHVVLAGFLWFVLLFGCFIVGRVAWRNRVAWRARRVQRRNAREFDREVAFYHRFERLLARHRLARPAGQTPYEFAARVERYLAQTLQSSDAAGLPALIVEAFYRVRFGSRPLDNEESAQVERAITRLRGVLGGAAGDGSPNGSNRFALKGHD